MQLHELPTPCLVIERHRLERNLERMQKRADENRTRLRPHIKTHKSLALAGRQRGLGAAGIAVAKPAEAEVFVGGGFDDVRVAYPVVERDKHERLRRLMDRARISFCVDTLEGAQAASDVYATHGLRAEVLLEIDTGYGRTGVPWDEERGTELADRVRSLPGLELIGILTHAGHSYAGPRAGEQPAAALRRVAAEERDRMLDFARRLDEASLLDGSLEISIGSTPTMAVFENATAGRFTISEIRPGNYVFFDLTQVALGAAKLEDCALTVLTTVVSTQRDAAGLRAFLDAGKKVLTSDVRFGAEGFGVLLEDASAMTPLAGARLHALSEEHGWVRLDEGTRLAVGQRVRVVPNHACVTVNTLDTLYLVDGDEVAETWRVDARGRVG